MSCINKLSIQGIRSFGPSDNDKQIIQFYNPLTLILGENGTGKTTLIEALKYATTGDQPPNSKDGNFIHDPKLAGVYEVKSQVKLQFNDVKGKVVTITRSLVGTQKAKKVSVNTLDSTIHRKDQDQTTSVSNRCADINREMIACLGVSKPILNNVIFCHQEEANWPLAEGRVLKQKFDEIFAATRYIKALKDICDLRKEMAEDVRVDKETLKHYQTNKEQATQFKKDLDENETRLAASTDSIQKVNEKLAPLEEKLEKLEKKEYDIAKVAAEIATKETQLSEIQRSIQNLRSNIKELFTGSTDELRRVMLNFDMELQDKESSMKNLEYEIKQKQTQVQSKGKEKSQKLLIVGKLKMEAEQHKDRKKKRDELIVSLSRRYNLTGFDSLGQEFSSSQVEKFLEAMDAKLSSVTDEYKEVKASYEAKEIEIQNKLDTLRDSKTKLEQSIRLKGESVDKNRTELRQIESELRHIDASAAQQSQVDTELDRAERELTDVEHNLDVNSVRGSIDTMKRERTQYEMELRQLDTEMQRMHLQSSTQAELDLLRSHKIAKTDMIKRILQTNEDTLNHILGHIPSENIRDEVEEAHKKLSDSIDKVSKDMQKLQIKNSTAVLERKMLQSQLEKKESELRGFEEKIFQTCGSQDFDSGLKVLKKSMADLQDEKAGLLGTNFVYKKFMTKLKKEAACPVCRKDIEDQQDVNELLREMEKKLSIIPSQLSTKGKQLEEQQQKYNSLIQLQPLKTQMGMLSDTEIPELRKNIKSLEETVAQNQRQLTEFEDSLAVQQVDLAMAKSVQTDVINVHQTQVELRKLDKKISSLASKIIGGDSSRSIHQVNKEKETLQHKNDRLKQDLERQQESLSDHMELVQQLRAKVNDLRTEQLDISKQLSRHKTLEEKRSELVSNVKESERIIRQDKEQLAPLEDKLQGKRKERETILKTKDRELDGVKQKLNELENRHKNLAVMQREIENYSAQGKDQLFSDVEDELHVLDEQLQQLEQEKISVSQKMDEARKEVSTQEVRKRELKDNFDLRKKEKEIENIKTQKMELEEEYGDLNIRKIQQEKKNCKQIVDKLMTEKNQVQGRKKELETNIRKLNEILKQEIYSKANKLHKDKMIDVKTAEIAMSDLKKYHDALDNAIMQYHMAKMEEINKIIHELWQKTYHGHDIDYIKIQTDQDDTTTKGEKRRVYHYRVVMYKGDLVPMDMRGRCSAGQKVLASLIIRLALAEVFCISCGVFTLDEPTTNLDRENILSLARSLTHIVKARKKQQNFQLVVISHDEDFIRMLSNSECVEYYYRVQRNDVGNTRVNKCKLSSLELREQN